MVQQLIPKLQNDLYKKDTPGVILLELRRYWLNKFIEKYKCDEEALELGFLLSDFKLQEATMLRKQNEHMRMALDYATQVFENYDLSSDRQQIVFEIIRTHHGGTQTHIESKLVKNADCLAFLEPKGWMHYFGSFYLAKTEDGFNDAFNKVDVKLKEKIELVDLDPETLAEANKLYKYFKTITLRITI